MYGDDDEISENLLAGRTGRPFLSSYCSCLILVSCFPTFPLHTTFSRLAGTSLKTGPRYVPDSEGELRAQSSGARCDSTTELPGPGFAKICPLSWMFSEPRRRKSGPHIQDKPISPSFFPRHAACCMLLPLFISPYAKRFFPFSACLSRVGLIMVPTCLAWPGLAWALPCGRGQESLQQRILTSSTHRDRTLASATHFPSLLRPLLLLLPCMYSVVVSM